MSKENLINDFILEATKEVPSQEKVSAIVNQYDNDDDLINDLYVHYKGEAPDAERLNIVKGQYLSNTEAPVKKKEETLEVTSQEDVTVSNSSGEETLTSSESSEVQTVSNDNPNQTVEVEEETTEVEKIPPAPQRNGEIFVNEETGFVSESPTYEGQPPSTHLMRAEQLEDGSWVAFPSLFQDENGSWLSMSKEEDWMNTYNEAKRRGEVVEFGENKEEALAYGMGSWKNPSVEKSSTEVIEEDNSLIGTVGAPSSDSQPAESEELSVDSEREVLQDNLTQRGFVQNTEGQWVKPSQVTGFGVTGVDGQDGITGAQDEAGTQGAVGVQGVGGEQGVGQQTNDQLQSIIDEDVIDNIKSSPVNGDQVIDLYVDFSKNGNNSEIGNKLGYNTFEDYYKGNPMHSVAFQKLNMQSLAEDIKTRNPEFNEVGLINPRYENFNYDQGKFTDLNKDQATFLVDMEVGDFATVNGNLTTGLFKDQEDLIQTAGLYKLRNNIGYQINNTVDLNNQLSSVPISYTNPDDGTSININVPISPRLLSKEKNKQYMKNIKDGMLLSADWGIVNGEWVAKSDPNTRVYDPTTNMVIGKYDNLNPEVKVYNINQDKQAELIKKSYGPESLIALERDIYFQLLNVSKLIKANPEDEIDRGTMQVAAEFLAGLTFDSYEDRAKELSENPGNATVDTPTSDILTLLPDENNYHLRAGLPFISSKTESVALYNRLRHELDAVHRAVVLNENPLTSNRYVDAGLMMSSIGAPGKDREGSDVVSADGYNILGDFFPNFDRALSRSGQGFIGGFYGQGVGEEVYSPLEIGKGDYYVSALQRAGVTGEQMEADEQYTQPDAYDEWGFITGTIGEMLLELKGGAGILKAPSTIKGASTAYKAGRAGDVAYESQKATNIFNGARTYVAKEVNSPWLAGIMDIGISSIEGGSTAMVTGLGTDKDISFGGEYDPLMFAGFGAATTGLGVFAKGLRNSKVGQNVMQAVNQFESTPVGRYVPIETTSRVVGNVTDAAAGTGMMFAVENFEKLFEDGGGVNTQMYIESLPDEVKNEGKAQTMFWFLLSSKMLNSKTGKSLMYDIGKFKYGVPNYSSFFRSTEGYNAWKNSQNPAESNRLLKSGFEDVMTSGNAAQKANANTNANIVTYNSNLSETKGAIDNYITAENNLIKTQNGLNNLSSNPGSVSTLGNQEGVSTILALSDVPVSSISSQAKANVRNGDATEERTQEAINITQQIIVKSAEIGNTIPNPVNKAKYINADLVTDKLQRELDDLNNPEINPVQNSPVVQSKKDAVQAKLDQANKVKEEIVNDVETPLEYVESLLQSDSRMKSELVDNANEVREKHPRLVEIARDLSNKGVTNPQREALKLYRDELKNQPAPEEVVVTEEPVLEAEVVTTEPAPQEKVELFTSEQQLKIEELTKRKNEILNIGVAEVSGGELTDVKELTSEQLKELDQIDNELNSTITEGKTNDELIELSKSNEDIPIEIRLEDQTTPSKISHLPEEIELIHLSKKQKDISPNIDLSEVPDADKYGGGESFVEGLYLSDSPLWNEGSGSRLPNYEGANKVKIKNDGLIFFDDAVGFEAYVREKYGKELEGLNGLEFQKKVKELLVNDGVKGVLSKSFDDWANELVVLDPSIIISSESSSNTPGEYNPKLYENTTKLPRSRDAVKKEQEFIELNKPKQDAVQESSTAEISTQEPPADSQTMGESVPQPEVATEEVKVKEEVEVKPGSETIKEEVVVEGDIKPRKPGTVDPTPRRQYKIDKKLDEISVDQGGNRVSETSQRMELKKQGYSQRQIDNAINRRDRVALNELTNLKKDLKRQAEGQEKYTVKATKEFKQTLDDIVKSMARDKSIKFSRSELKNILDAATGTEMQYLDVDKALNKAINTVEKVVKRSYIEDITKNSKKEAVERKGKKGKDRGKVSLGARNLWNELTNQYSKDDLKNMTISELADIDDQLNSILSDGKLDLKSYERVKRTQNQIQRGSIDEGLYRKEKPTKLNTFEDTKKFLADNRNNFVIINGQQINGVEPLNEYIKANPLINIEGAKGYTTPSPSEISRDQRKSKIGKMGRRFVKGYETIDNATQKLRRVGGPKVEKAVEDLTNAVIDSNYDYLEGTYGVMLPKVKAVEKGVSSARRNKGSDVYVGSSKTPLTNGEVVNAYMMMEVNGPQSLVNANLDPKAVVDYMKKNPDLIDLSERAFQFYEDALLRYGDKAESITGIPLKDIKNLARYAPTNRDVVEEESVDLFSPDGTYRGMDVISRNIKPKTDKDGAIKIVDVMTQMGKYVDDMEKMLSYYDVSQQYNNVFNNNSVPQMKRLLGKDGDQDLTKIMEVYDEAITGRAKNQRVPEPAEKVLRGVNKFGIVKTLGLKPEGLTSQLLSGAMYAPLIMTDPNYDIGFKDIVSGNIKMLSPNRKIPTNRGELDKEVTFLRRFLADPMFEARWKKTSIDPAFTKYKNESEASNSEKLWDLAQNVLMAGTKVGDMGGVYAGAGTAYALYDSYLKKGMSTDDAMNRAMKDYHKLTIKFQQTDNPLYTSRVAKDAFGQFATQYTSTPTALANETALTVKKFRNWKSYNKEDKYKLLRRLAQVAVVPSLLYNYVRSDYNEEGEEVDRRMKNIPEVTNEGVLETDRKYGLMMNTMQGLGQGFGLPGVLSNFGINALRGRPMSFSSTAIQSELEKMYNVGGVGFDMLAGNKKWDELTDEDLKTFDKYLGNIDNFIKDEVPGLVTGELDFKDFMLGRDPKTYGKGFEKDKLMRYNKDQIRNYFFGFSDPADMKKMQNEFNKTDKGKSVMKSGGLERSSLGD